MTTSPQKNLAILVGGGPAPGINSVISAATIRAQLEGVTVLGIRDGFQWLMQGNIEHVHPLTIDEVSRIHFRGGSHIGIARANPTKDPQLLENAVISLLRLNVRAGLPNIRPGTRNPVRLPRSIWRPPRGSATRSS